MNIKQELLKLLERRVFNAEELVDEIDKLYKKAHDVSVRSEKLPSFLYEEDGDIKIGYHGDSVVTDEWNKWNNVNCH
jgi:hypothetical protein